MVYALSYPFEMITLRDRSTYNLFDPWESLGEKRRKLLDRCWAGVFREHLLKQLPAAKLADKLTESFGRPSKDLHVVLGALVLQQLHDLTDAATVEAVSFNIAWHYALDIQHSSESYICQRTLRTYRRWVIDKGLDEELFEHLTDKLINAFAVDTTRQRIDSTAVRSAMRTMTRLGILVAAVSKFLRELARHNPALHAQVEPQIIQRYVDREGECFGFGKPSETKRQLPEAAQVLADLVTQYRDTSAADLESYLVLSRVFEEQCEVVHSTTEDLLVQVKEPSTIPSDTVQNPSDPDASYNSHRGVGYLVQVVETYTPESPSEDNKPNLITYIDVQKMTQHDSRAIEPALDELERRAIKPAVILGDSHYGSVETMKRIVQTGVEVVSPSMPPRGYKLGKLNLEDFQLDASGVVVSCPAGLVPVSTSQSTKRIEVQFDQDDCSSCKDRQRCPGYTQSKSVNNRRWQYTPDRVAQRRRRLAEKSEYFIDRYRWRAGIEATMSRLKHQMGLSSLRVRGRHSLKYAVYLRALGMNIKRVAAYTG
jgi:hypothetical protein